LLVESYRRHGCGSNTAHAPLLDPSGLLMSRSSEACTPRGGKDRRLLVLNETFRRLQQLQVAIQDFGWMTGVFLNHRVVPGNVGCLQAALKQHLPVLFTAPSTLTHLGQAIENFLRRRSPRGNAMPLLDFGTK